MREFVAIDFETANEQRRSACAVGLVSFDGEGKLSDSYYKLLRPHPEVDYFNPANVWVHGITSEDVQDAPQWPDIAGQVMTFIGDRPVMAHNTAFDGYVLSDLASLYDTEEIPSRRSCTVRLAREILADKLERKAPDEVLDYYSPGEVFDHHHADADAQAAGMIFARMQHEFGFEKLSELCPPTKNNHKPPIHPGMRSDQLAAEELIKIYGNTRALEGECAAFTGTLRHGRRAGVEQLVLAAGGATDKNLTKQTILLVVDIPNPSAWKEGTSAPRKLMKASQLHDSGSPIEVISEGKFFNHLSD